MTKENPVGLEDIAVLGLEDFRIVVDAAINPEYAALRPIVDVVRKASPIPQVAVRLPCTKLN